VGWLHKIKPTPQLLQPARGPPLNPAPPPPPAPHWHHFHFDQKKHPSQVSDYRMGPEDLKMAPKDNGSDEILLEEESHYHFELQAPFSRYFVGHQCLASKHMFSRVRMTATSSRYLLAWRPKSVVLSTLVHPPTRSKSSSWLDCRFS
jgi:hypothetical protein